MNRPVRLRSHEKLAKDVAGPSPEVARDTIHLFDLTFARGADIAWELRKKSSHRCWAVIQFPIQPQPGRHTAHY